MIAPDYVTCIPFGLVYLHEVVVEQILEAAPYKAGVIQSLASHLTKHTMAQSAGATKYTDCIFAEALDSHIEYSGYNTKQSDCEAPVMLELWGMQSTLLLPSLPDPVRPGVVAPDRVLSMDLIELNWILMLKWIVWNRTVLHLNVYKQKNCTYA